MATWTDEKTQIEEAANGYILGIPLEDISDQTGVSIRKLGQWRTKYQWVKRKAEFEKNITGSIQMSYDILKKSQERLKEALEDGDEDLGDLGAFLSLVIKLEAQFRDQKQIVSVDPMQVSLGTMERFQQYLTEHDHAGHEFMAAHIEGFIADLNMNPLE